MFRKCHLEICLSFAWTHIKVKHFVKNALKNELFYACDNKSLFNHGLYLLNHGLYLFVKRYGHINVYKYLIPKEMLQPTA